MIPLFKVKMSDSASELVSAVLASGFIGQGSKVEEFEDLLWKELKTNIRPITVNSCTSAIDLALHLCKVGPGDEVISTPQTCFASQVGIIHRNATIRWADIDPMTGLMNPDSVKNLITSKTKAIVSVNWAGKICDYAALKSFGVPVIEDAAHTWDSFLQNPIERGDYICYSFQAIKFLTTSDGGLLITPEDKQDDARLLRWYGLDRTKNQSFRCTQNIIEAGFKYHMNDVCAAIGICNIPEARDSVIKHRENAKFYSENLKECSSVSVLDFDDTCSYWLYSLLVESGTRDEFISYLNQNGITASPVHHRNDLYECTSKFSEGSLLGVDKFYEKQVSIPVGWWVTSEERSYIVNTIKSYFPNG
jgi:dTDP-4-amino-4,6-dideoxygalactose transaminase